MTIEHSTDACVCGCITEAHIYGSPAQGWCCLRHLLTCPTLQRPIITLGTQAYPVRQEAVDALADAGAEIAAGLADATDVLVAILTIEGYGEDMNVRLHTH